MRLGIINIGASAFRMYITEFTDEEEHSLDFLLKPLRLGTDTFNKGYISLDNVKKSTEILKMFKLKLEEYAVTKYRALCTSGVREAVNKDFFLDYTLLHSGIKLEVLEPSEEIHIKYVGAKQSVPAFDTLEKEGLVLANVASGNVTLIATKKNQVVFSGTLPYGSLRLRQMFRHISHLKRYKAIEEYVRIMIESVAASIEPKTLTHLIGAGSSINLMLELFKISSDRIYLDILEDTYKKVRSLSLSEISEELGLRKDQASVLVPTIITYMELLKFLRARFFTFSRDSFPHTMSLYYAGKIYDPHLKTRIKNTLFHIAQKYGCNIEHAKCIALFTKTLFDELKDLHSLSKRMRFVLDTAIILNDVGKYIAPQHYYINSCNIIKSLQIPGVEGELLHTAACVVYEANRTEDSRLMEAAYLKDELTIKKLAALHKIASTLDAGHGRHIKGIRITVSDVIVIDADTECDPYIEIYAFERAKSYFAEVFGISIELNAKIRYD